MTSTGRLTYLDGLRGILAIIVFIHHFLYAFYPDIIFGGNYQEFSNSGAFGVKRLIALSPLNILFNPGIAIHLFFILSGYVQTRHYFEHNNFTFLQKSFIKRYFRLAVPVVFTVLLVYIFHRLHLLHNHAFPANTLSAAWLASLLPDNLGFFEVLLHGGYECFNGMSHYYQVLWTMPVELYNSFMVLILAIVTHKLRNKVYLFAFWILVQLFVLHAYYSVAFTFGMLAGYLQLNSTRFNFILSKTAAKITCLIVGIYFASYPYTGYQNAVLNSVYRPISFFEVYPHIISYLIGGLFIFCSLLYSTRFQKILLVTILRFFGTISFMFYLLHFLLLLSFSPWLYGLLAGSVSTGLNLLITGLLTFLLITVFSFICYKLVDLPALKLCNKLVKRIFESTNPDKGTIDIKQT